MAKILAKDKLLPFTVAEIDRQMDRILYGPGRVNTICVSLQLEKLQTQL